MKQRRSSQLDRIEFVRLQLGSVRDEPVLKSGRINFDVELQSQGVVADSEGLMWAEVGRRDVT